MALMMLPQMSEYVVVPKFISRIVSMYSAMVSGTMSPKPTVEAVISTKYRVSRYRS